MRSPGSIFFFFASTFNQHNDFFYSSCCISTDSIMSPAAVDCIMKARPPESQRWDKVTGSMWLVRDFKSPRVPTPRLSWISIGAASLLKALAYRRRWFKLISSEKKGIHLVCPWTPGAPSVQTAIKCSFVIWIEASLPAGASLLGPKQKCTIFMALCLAAIRKTAHLHFNSFPLLLQWLKNQLGRLTRPHLQFISITQQSSWGYQHPPPTPLPTPLLMWPYWVWRTQVKARRCHVAAHSAAAARHKLRGC